MASLKDKKKKSTDAKKVKEIETVKASESEKIVPEQEEKTAKPTKKNKKEKKKKKNAKEEGKRRFSFYPVKEGAEEIDPDKIYTEKEREEQEEELKKKMLGKDYNAEKHPEYMINNVEVHKVLETTYNLDMNDEFECRKAVEIYPLNIVKTKKSFRENPNNYKKIIQQYPEILYIAPENIKEDEEIAEMAVNSDPYTIGAVSRQNPGFEKFMEEAEGSYKWAENRYSNPEGTKHIRNIIQRLLEMEDESKEEVVKVEEKKQREAVQGGTDRKNGTISERNANINRNSVRKPIEVPKNKPREVSGEGIERNKRMADRIERLNDAERTSENKSEKQEIRQGNERVSYQDNFNKMYENRERHGDSRESVKPVSSRNIESSRTNDIDNTSEEENDKLMNEFLSRDNFFNLGAEPNESRHSSRSDDVTNKKSVEEMLAEIENEANGDTSRAEIEEDIPKFETEIEEQEDRKITQRKVDNARDEDLDESTENIMKILDGWAKEI